VRSGIDQGAFIRTVARQEVEEQRRVGELPLLRAVAALEELAEQVLGLLAVQEMLLIGGALIGVTGLIVTSTPRLVMWSMNVARLSGDASLKTVQLT
jgi:hypothetical protein